MTPPTRWRYIGAAIALAVAVLGVAARSPRTGALVVTAAGAGNVALSAVEIYVDGQKRCDASPCTLATLAAGKHRVTAKATGYLPLTELEVTVASGGVSQCALMLSRTTTTGIQLLAGQEGLRFSIDGKELGDVLETVIPVTTGEHAIRVTASERYAAMETRVTAGPGEVVLVGPVRLKVLRGLATIVVGSGFEDARISLVNGNSTRRLTSFPTTLDVPTDEEFTVVAARTGYRPFEIPLRFEDGRAERTFTVSFADDIREVPPPRGCNCAPGDLMCAMKCAAANAGQHDTPLDGAAISKVISEHTPAARRECWDPAVKKRAESAPASARVAVAISIAPSGRVENVSTSGDPKGYPGLASCLQTHVYRWRFPRSSGPTVTANVPFVFAAP